MNQQNEGSTSNTSSGVGGIEYALNQDSAMVAYHKQQFGEMKDERQKTDVRRHTHDGANSERIGIENLVGFIRTVSAAPTWIPKSFEEQFALYANGATYRLYCYDSINKAWRYAALT